MKRLILVFALVISAITSAPASAQDKPNILIIWGDDIGQSNISAYTMGLVGYRTPAFEDWLHHMADVWLGSARNTTLRRMFEDRPNNWGTHAFGALIAIYRYLGDEASMLDAIEKIELWTRAVQDLTAPAVSSFELLNMLTVARLVAQGALARKESRGVHYRLDFTSLSKDTPAHNELTPRCESGAILGIEVAATPANELTT